MLCLLSVMHVLVVFPGVLLSLAAALKYRVCGLVPRMEAKAAVDPHQRPEAAVQVVD
jgi:hypothetical protein